jgi:hypothetical protein
MGGRGEALERGRQDKTEKRRPNEERDQRRTDVGSRIHRLTMVSSGL